MTPHEACENSHGLESGVRSRGAIHRVQTGEVDFHTKRLHQQAITRQNPPQSHNLIRGIILLSRPVLALKNCSALQFEEEKPS